MFWMFEREDKNRYRRYLYLLDVLNASPQTIKTVFIILPTFLLCLVSAAIHYLQDWDFTNSSVPSVKLQWGFVSCVRLLQATAPGGLQEFEEAQGQIYNQSKLHSSNLHGQVMRGNLMPWNGDDLPVTKDGQCNICHRVFCLTCNLPHHKGECAPQQL